MTVPEQAEKKCVVHVSVVKVVHFLLVMNRSVKGCCLVNERFLHGSAMKSPVY